MQKCYKASLIIAILTVAIPLQAQSLRGSAASMQRQNQQAVAYGYSFLRSSQSVTEFVNNGYLVKVNEDREMELHDVSFPYARPEVKLFLDRLSAQYRNACGEKLVVTSLVRPINRQPANAANNSVHPTGMALDLRVPRKSSCRSWLERTLLSLEGSNILDVTRERRPPHYHVALFTQTYENYVAELTRRNSQSAEQYRDYQVRRGDSLWGIANRTGTTVASLRAANNLSGNLISPGQKLRIPGGGSAINTLGPNELAAVTEVTYRVKKGDSLWSISNRYGASVSEIRSQNGLRGDMLQVGQVLRITTRQ